MVANIKEIDMKAFVFLNEISRVQHGKVKNVPVCTQGSFWSCLGPCGALEYVEIFSWFGVSGSVLQPPSRSPQMSM